MRRLVVLLLACAGARADTTAPQSAGAQSLPWTDRCAARLEAKRREWGRNDYWFRTAYVHFEKVNGGHDGVGFHMMGGYETPGFWISISDEPVHSRPEAEMEGADGWEPMVRSIKLNYPVLLRHVHPRSASRAERGEVPAPRPCRGACPCRSARMQAERGVPVARWQAFVEAWQPLVDACLLD